MEPKLVRFVSETLWFPASSSTHPLGRLPILPKYTSASVSRMAALAGLLAPQRVAGWTSSQVSPKGSPASQGDVPRNFWVWGCYILCQLLVVF